MTSRRRILLILLPILLLALSLRLIGIEKSLFERQPSAWRQIHTNTTSQGYLQHGFRFFYPEVNFLGNPGYQAMEFPLYQYLVAVLYKFLGENVIWGRGLTVITSLGALIYLYFILRKFWGEVPAAAGALYFAVIPLSAYYGRTVMIDVPVLFLSLGFSYHFLSYMDKGYRRSLILSVTLSVLAVLIKVTVAVVFWGPLLILPLVLGKKNIYKKWGFYLFLGLPFIAGYLWKIYAESLNLRYGSPFFQYATKYFWSFYLGPWRMRLDPNFYQILFLRTVRQGLTWTGIFLAGGGLFLSFYKQELRPLLLYLLAALVYLLTFTNLNYIHDYYQLPLIPIYAAFLGVFTGFFIEKFKNYISQKNLLSKGIMEKYFFPFMVILVGILIVIPSVGQLWKYNKIINQELIFQGKQISRILPPQALVIAVDSEGYLPPQYPHLAIYNINPSNLYAVERRGWNLNYSRFTLSKVELLKQEGAQFLIMDLVYDSPQEGMWRDMILKTLRKNYKEIFATYDFLVFDLNKPPLINS